MRYGTWIVNFTTDITEGTTPLLTLGVFYSAPDTIVGYLPEDTDVAALEYWQVSELSEAQFLAAALLANPLATMVDGLLVIPMPSLTP
jgi:hypothetical protein